MKKKTNILLTFGTGLLLFGIAGCVNIVQQDSPSAIQAAVNRGKFELNCPNVEATVLSEKAIQGWRFEGSEHTIGVRGCGRQAVYVTYCRDPEDCNAFAQTGRVEQLSRDMMP